jgi:DNA-binding MarR family transcriptional regulator
VVPDPDEIRLYISQNLGVTVSPARWSGEGRLPLYLQSGYAFYEAEILDLACLLMTDLGEQSPAAATIRKHMDHVRSKWPGEIIYVRGQVAAYQRKRLIEQKVPFIIPGNQMYLPVLGIDLREHFRRLRRPSRTLSPATQVVVLHTLLCSDECLCTPAALAERLGYTKMTMTRAFHELDAAGLADISMQGRRRCLTFKSNRRDLWEKALPLLRSPVNKRLHVRLAARKRVGPAAGLSALASYSMLATPSISTAATSVEQWKAFQQREDFAATAADDPESQEVEVWSYNPELLSGGQIVDRLSLYLSLKDNEDERVEAALEHMMEAVSW